MRVPNQILFPFVGIGLFCIDLRSQDDKSTEQRQERVILSEADIHYIYNRAFDIALRDAGSTVDLGSIYHNSDYLKYDTIIVTIDPILNNEAFEIFYIDEIDNISFDYPLHTQDRFDNISFINTGAIKYYHWDTIPLLKDRHMMHVVFSDIYVSGNQLFLGVITYHQTKFFNVSIWG